VRHLITKISNNRLCVTWLRDVCAPSPPFLCVLLCVIDPRVRKIINKASTCPGIISRTFNVRERTLLARVQTRFITYDEHKNGHKNRSCFTMCSVMDIIFIRSKAFCALVRKWFGAIWAHLLTNLCLRARLALTPKFFAPIGSTVRTRIASTVCVCLSFFLGFRRPNLITGLSGWRTPD